MRLMRLDDGRMAAVGDDDGRLAAVGDDALPWCIAMSESRPDNATSAFWSAAADINRAFAAAHGYGFYRAHLPSGAREPSCVHPAHGVRAAAWCKLAVVLRLLLLGVRGRPCAHVMYLDSDAFFLNVSMNIDEYLSRARDVGDEAVQDDRWQLMLASDAPHHPAGPCTGVFWVKNTPDGCGLVRSWWDWPVPAERARTLKKPWDQGAAVSFYVASRPFGDRVRVLFTGQFFHFALHRGAPADPFVVHVMTRRAHEAPVGLATLMRAVLAAARAARTSGTTGTAPPAAVEESFRASSLVPLLTRLGARGACTPAPRGVDSFGRRLPRSTTEGTSGAPLLPLHTNLDGTPHARRAELAKRRGGASGDAEGWRAAGLQLLQPLLGRPPRTPPAAVVSLRQPVAAARRCWKARGRRNESQRWACWDRWWDDVARRLGTAERERGASMPAVASNTTRPATNIKVQDPAPRCLARDGRGPPAQTLWCRLVHPEQLPLRWR